MSMRGGRCLWHIRRNHLFPGRASGGNTKAY